MEGVKSWLLVVGILSMVGWWNVYKEVTEYAEKAPQGEGLREAIPVAPPSAAPEPSPEPCELLMDLGADYGNRIIPEWALAVVTIRMEADAEPFEGKVAVGKVLRNRTRMKYASDGTLSETILRPWQFSAWNTDHPRRGRVCGAPLDSPLTQDALRAWEESEHYTGLTERVVLYHTAAKPVGAGRWPPTWALNAEFERQIGAHVFYRD